jgi:transcriptional regulator with GAF, ATPase, and Fis domain
MRLGRWTTWSSRSTWTSWNWSSAAPWTATASAGRAVDTATSLRRTPDLLGDSPAMQPACGSWSTVADSEVTVLVTGESGVGKELVAHALHRTSRRRGRTLRGGGLLHAAGNLFESELFGHERGAFTGADRRKPG